MLPFVQASSASMLLNRCKLNWVSYYRCFPLESFAKPLEHPGKTLGTSLEAETHQAFNHPTVCPSLLRFAAIFGILFFISVAKLSIVAYVYALV